MKLLTACVTPFLPDHTVDFLSLDALLSYQEEAGNGLVLFGSTGENLSLSIREKEEILSFACRKGLSVPLVVGVSGTSLHEASEWMRIARDYPIFGFLVTTPVYAKPGVYGQTAWLESLLDIAHKPVILYNIPSRAGVPLYVEAVRMLVDHPYCYGIKDSGGSLTSFLSYKPFHRQLVLYCGDDGLWPQMYQEGAQGLISVLSNMWAKEARAYVANCHHPVQSQLWEHTCRWLNQTTNPIAIKAILADQKKIAHFIMRSPLSVEDFHYHSSLPDVVAYMAQWPNIHSVEHTSC